MAEGRLTGKVAFVTGAARGMGRAHAARLARDGADIIICDACRDYETVSYAQSTLADLAETEALVRKEGRRVVSRRADVRDMAQLQALVDEGVAELGRLDIVVANAGINSTGNCWELTSDQFDEVVSVNLKGVWQTAKAAIPTLIRQGSGGVIVMTGSTSAVKGLPFIAHYTAAKHGVVGLMKALAVELGQYSIRVVVVHPTATRTGMTSGQTKPGVVAPDFQAMISANPGVQSVFDHTLPVEMMEPEDVANLVAFLASDEARYITGSEFRVDLGNLCR